ncbi:F-box/kelch-repeat protein At3g23880-like [Trifolium pratense]|uniref:F-box/kelch-repeat protein At3g23880-like n=1 Tax=Trifolium pratense TaxID=57577 RepID=UPI001E695296|nr:F-box/kelch-repeat protein At3g23880-like [Trifolium pratense]
MNTEPQNSRCCRGLSEPTPTAFLSEDLIVEIISWLRVKPLMKMKCVSKSFNSLICDPKFVKMHRKRSSRNTLSYLVSYKDDFKKVDEDTVVWSMTNLHNNNNLPAEDDYSFVPFSVGDLLKTPSMIPSLDDPYYCLIDKDCRKVVGSCNGLVCLLGSSEHQTWFRFWNPATRTISNKLGFLCNVKYRYKLTDWRFTFGYDNSTDTYKVVALLLGNHPRKTVVRVLNFGDNIWRSIPSFPAKPLQVAVSSQISRGFNGVHLNGTVNWLAFGRGRSDLFVIVSLDLSTETYKIFRVPRFSHEELNVIPRLCVMMNNLYLYHDVNKTDFVIWIMTKFGDDKSWTRNHLLSSHDVLGLNIKYDLFSCFNLYLNRGTMLFLQDDKAILAHLLTGTPLKSIFNKKICWLSMNNYVETLVSTR